MKPLVALNREVALELSQSIDQTLDLASCIDQSRLMKLYNVSMVACKSKCRGVKGNPTCFCSLVPQENGFKKKGLWMTEKAVLKTLGPDPEDKQRKDLSYPAGLRNLGNTCYANTALQCLFSVSSFRHALYTIFSPSSTSVASTSTAEPSSSVKQRVGDEVASQLGALFLDLEYGSSSSADTTLFAKSLQLDHSVQQDCQEFFKLLVTKIENVFGKEAEGSIKSLVQSLFCGKYSYVTTCKSCGKESATSSNLSDYYELSLQVKGAPSLKDSLLSSLEKDILDGNNQYACEHCRQKSDATRQMVLRSLPPYLCFQLQRFVYDPRKDDKLKVSDKFSFPLDLDLDSILQGTGGISSLSSSSSSEAGAGDYELTGVVLHKGSNAHHGHYVAHIRDETTGKWWRFDDENAECMGAAPTGYSNDHGGGNGGKAGASTTIEEDEVMEVGKGKGKSKGDKKGKGEKSSEKKAKKPALDAKGKKRRKEQEETEEDEEYVPDESEDPADDIIEDESEDSPGAKKTKPQGVLAEEAAPAGTMVSSSNAYMLLYRKKGWDGSALGLSGSSLYSSSSALEELPERARAYVTSSDQSWVDQKEEYRRRMRETLEMVERRKNEVKDVLSIASSSPDHWIHTSWFESWATSEDPIPPIPNQTLTCPHGKLDPSKIKEMKLISSMAWVQLQTVYGGGPEFKSSNFCSTCIRQALDETAGIKEVLEVREALKTLMISSTGNGLPDGFDPHATALALTLASVAQVNGPSKAASSSKAAERSKDSKGEESKSAAAPRGRGRPSGRPSKRNKKEAEEAATKAEVVEIQSDGEDEVEIQQQRSIEIEPSIFWVSKSWLSAWLKRTSTTITTSPTTSITCPHNKLRPERPGIAESKRFAIPRRAWLLIKSSWERERERRAHSLCKVKGEKEEKLEEGDVKKGDEDDDEVMIVEAKVDQDISIIDLPPTNAPSKEESPSQIIDLSRGPSEKIAPLEASTTALKDTVLIELPAGLVDECAICVASLNATVGDAEDRRRDLVGEKHALQNLMESKETVNSIEEGAPYYLLPRSWLSMWQKYIQQGTSKRATDVASSVSHPRPPPLPRALSELFCPCHGDLLRVIPPKVSFRRNRCVLDPDESVNCEVDVIGAQDWENLRAFYGLPDDLDAESAGMQPAAVEGIRVFLTLPTSYAAGEDGGGSGSGGMLPGSKRRRGSASDAVKGHQEAVEGHQDEGKGAGSRSRRGVRGSKGEHEVVVVEEEGEEERKRSRASGSRSGSGGMQMDPPTALDQPARRATRARSAATNAAAAPPPGAFPSGEPLMGGGFAPLSAALPGSNELAAAHHGDGAEIAMGVLMMGSASVDMPLPPILFPYLTTIPGPCNDYYSKTAQESKAALLTYQGVDMIVEVIEKNALGEFLLSCQTLASAAHADRGERRSRRRKGRGSIKVNSWMPLSEVKLLIYQALDIHPANQDIYSSRGKLIAGAGGCLIAGEGETLANREVYPDDELRVVDAQVVDGEDYSFLEGSGIKPKRGRREAETGFTGTALVSSLLPSPPTPAAAGVLNGGPDSVDVKDDELEVEIQEHRVSEAL